MVKIHKKAGKEEVGESTKISKRITAKQKGLGSKTLCAMHAAAAAHLLEHEVGGVDGDGGSGAVLL